MIPAVREALGSVYSLRKGQNRPITKVSLKLNLLPVPDISDSHDVMERKHE